MRICLSPSVMVGKAAYDYFTSTAREAPNWRNEVTLRSSENSRGQENGAYMPLISPTPLMLILALNDELAPPDLALEAFEKALPPKKLVLLPGGHFTPYREEFALTSSAARDWFNLHLREGGSRALNQAA